MPARKSLKDRNKAAITGPLEEPTRESAIEAASESAVDPVVEAPTRPVGEQSISQPIIAEPTEEPAEAVRSRGAARPAQTLPAGTARLGLYLRQGTLEGAKSAYVADLDILTDPPSSFARWIAGALDAHIGRTPADRAQLAEAHPDPEEGNRGVNRAFILPVDTIARMEETTGIDRRAGRMQSVSQLAAEALRIAIHETKKRNGGILPVAPKRLPNKPTR